MTDLESKKNSSNDRREIESLEAAIKGVRKAVNVVNSHDEEKGDTSSSSRGRKPDEEFLAVLYLIISVAGGVKPQIGKYGSMVSPI